MVYGEHNVRSPFGASYRLLTQHASDQIGNIGFSVFRAGCRRDTSYILSRSMQQLQIGY